MKSNRLNPHLRVSTAFRTLGHAVALVATMMWACEARAAVVAISTTTYSQNFDSLASSGTSNSASGAVFTNGWSFVEGGSNANTTYSAGTGSGTAGDTYSFGVAGVNSVTDRAFGMLQSGSLSSVIGFQFSNNTGSTITSLALSYFGEEWRRAASNDSLVFSYQIGSSEIALNAASGWTTVSALNFTTPQLGTGAALDGNAAANRTSISSSISDLSIQNGQYVTIRWVDPTGSSSAGMAIDDFNLTLSLLAASDTYYWLGDDTTRGGSGTWAASGGTAFSATDADGATGIAWDSTKAASFGGGSGGNVTVSGTVSANAGLRFTSNGYTIEGGTALNLGGADAAANTITTATGVTSTINSVITGSNGFTKAGAGTLVLGGNNTFSGTALLTEGVTRVTHGGALGDIGAGTTVSSGAALEIAGGITTSAEPLSISGTGVGGNGALRNISDNNTFTGTITLGGASRIQSDSGLLTLSGGIASSNHNLTLGGAGNITVSSAMNLGSGSLTKSDAGTLTLEASNTYSGGTTITGGAVIASAADALGSGSVSISSGSLTINAANSYAGGTTISGGSVTAAAANALGTGSVSISSGSLALNASNSYSGGTTITGGTVTASAVNALGTGAVSISSGSLTVNASNSYSGGTTISGGSVVAGADGALGGGTVTMSGGSLLATNGVTVSNAITIPVQEGRLLITQYYEGTSSNKWIELTNVGGSSIDLSTYSLGIFTNAAAEGYKTGSSPGNTMALSGTLAPGSSWLGANSSAVLPGYATANASNTTVLGFNGNDSVVLWSGAYQLGNIKDAIGFTNTGNEGVDISFIRISTAAGYNNTAGSDVLDFSSIWSQAALAAVDSATSGTDNRLGYSSLSGGGSMPVIGSDITSGTASFSGDVSLLGSVSLTSAAGGTVAFSGTLGGNGGVTKVGAGIVELSGTNTYAGATTVSAGTLLLSGSVTSGVDVASGATLDGLGTVGGATGIDGHHIAGSAAIGTQEFSSDLTYAAGSSFTMQLGSQIGDDTGMLRGLEYDAIDVGGELLVEGGVFNLIVTGLDIEDSFWDTAQQWDVFDAASSSGTFSSFQLFDSTDLINPVVYGSEGGFTYDGATGTLHWSADAVPEPTNALAGLLVALGMFQRRRANGSRRWSKGGRVS